MRIPRREGALTLVVLGLAGAAIGFRIRTGVAATLGAIGLTLLFGMAFAWLALTAASRLRSADAVTSALDVVMLVLSFPSTGFVDAGDLPGWAQPIARHRNRADRRGDQLSRCGASAA